MGKFMMGFGLNVICVVKLFVVDFYGLLNVGDVIGFLFDE